VYHFKKAASATIMPTGTTMTVTPTSTATPTATPTPQPPTSNRWRGLWYIPGKYGESDSAWGNPHPEHHRDRQHEAADRGHLPVNSTVAFTVTGTLNNVQQWSNTPVLVLPSGAVNAQGSDPPPRRLGISRSCSRSFGGKAWFKMGTFSFTVLR